MGVRKFFFPVWTCIKPNLMSKMFPFTGEGGPPPKKLLRMSWNTFWFWNFWDPMIFFFGGGPSVRYRQTDTRHSDQISRSARRDGATNNSCIKHNSCLRHFQCHFRSDDVIMYTQNEVTAKWVHSIHSVNKFQPMNAA